MSIKSTENQTTDFKKQLIDLKNKFRQENIFKVLCPSALLIAAVAATVFLSSYFLTSGIGIIVISSYAIYKYFTCYQDSNNIFSRATNYVTEKLKSINFIQPTPGTSSQKPEVTPLSSSN